MAFLIGLELLPNDGKIFKEFFAMHHGAVIKGQ
jgi:hypothetical protein